MLKCRVHIISISNIESLVGNIYVSEVPYIVTNFALEHYWELFYSATSKSFISLMLFVLQWLMYVLLWYKDIQSSYPCQAKRQFNIPFFLKIHFTALLGSPL